MRYIDADALLESMPDDLPYKGSVKRVLMQAHSADVVPKSEVEKLQKHLAEMLVSEQTELHIPMEYLVRVRTEHPIYTAIKTEVAREIISETFKMVRENFVNTPICKVGLSDLESELKKKYTGKNNENASKSL